MEKIQQVQYDYSSLSGLNEPSYYNYYHNQPSPTNYYYNYFQTNSSQKYASPVTDSNKYYSPTNQQYGFSYNNSTSYYNSPTYVSKNHSVFYNKNSYYYSPLSQNNDSLPNSSAYYNYKDSAYHTQVDSSYNSNTPNRSNFSDLSINWPSNQQSTPIKTLSKNDKERKPKIKREQYEFNDNDCDEKENQVLKANFSNDIQACSTSKRPKLLKLNINPSCSDLDNKNDDQSYSKNNYNESNKFDCYKCNVSFNCAAKLIMHEYKIHKGGSTRQCPICSKKFGNQANAMVHLRAHTQEKTFKCHLCDNAFYDSSTLKKHLRTHTGEKPYECNLCNKKFTQSGNLKRHLLVHQKYDDYIVDNQNNTEDKSNQIKVKFVPEMSIQINSFNFNNSDYNLNFS